MREDARKPTWFTEAELGGIDYIVAVYEKAEGFVFCPRNLELPFRVGGDYGGNFPSGAEGALDHFENHFNQAYVERVKWIIPFVRKVAKGVDFSLRDLEYEKNNARVIKGRWPW